MTRTIGIYVFDNVEVLDFAGPYEVFTCASRVSRTLDPQLPAPFRVLTIGQSRAPVRARAVPRLRVQRRRRWIDNGKLVTSAGISAGIDMSLHLVERLSGRALALATARQMEYDWNEG